MVTIVKLLLGSVALVVFVWFGANVELGDRTLFEHLQRIGSSQETKDLIGGARQKGGPLVEEAKAKLTGKDGGVPLEDLSDDDRKALRRIIHERTADEQARARDAADKRSRDPDRRAPERDRPQ